MKRRGFFKFLGMAAVAPVAIAKAVEQAKEPQNPMYILTENAKPLGPWLRSRNPVPKSAWETERNIREQMNGATISIIFRPDDVITHESLRRKDHEQ